MNTLTITEAAHATLAGTLPLPEVVANQISAGIEHGLSGARTLVDSFDASSSA